MMAVFALRRRSGALRLRPEVAARMTDWSDEESYESLAKHRLGRSGLLVQLDRGFEPGVYGVCLEYHGLAEQIGFTEARRQALDYLYSATYCLSIIVFVLE